MPDLYRESIDQIATAEQLGFGSGPLSEHQFTTDDFAWSPLTVAADIGARRASRSSESLPSSQPRPIG